MTTKYHLLKRLSLSGLSHHQYALIPMDDLCTGATLTLQRQPDNQFDPNAIQVFFEDEQIGWIPKAENELLARLLDLEVDIICRIIAHSLTAPLQTRLYVGLYIGIQE